MKLNEASLPSLDELLAYAAWRVIEAAEECTFERLVYECFTLFPDAFGLKRYPQWPDSARVNKAWLRARTDKGWLVGSVQEGFRITETGFRVARRVASQLETSDHFGSRPSTGRSRERFEALIKVIRNDAVFKRFKDKRKQLILTEMDFRRLLGATMETPSRVLRQNLNAYLNAAIAYGDDDVVDFLRTCERKMVTVLKIVKESTNGGDRAN